MTNSDVERFRGGLFIVLYFYHFRGYVFIESGVLLSTCVEGNQLRLYIDQVVFFECAIFSEV